MSADRAGSTAAQRILQARIARADAGMADVIDLATRVMRARARRLVPFTTGRRAAPAFELLIVDDELAQLASGLADDRGKRDATGRVVRS
jgi:hypothetical protein